VSRLNFHYFSLIHRRWYKLVLTRELPFALALRLWDGIFAEDPSLGILDFVCVAMVLLIRNECESSLSQTVLNAHDSG
jgi:TBC1 domain family protein 5